MPGHPTDTIVAVSSPPGQSPRGLVRLSGPAVRPIVLSLTASSLPAPRQLTPARLLLAPDSSGDRASAPSKIENQKSKIPLPVLLAFFPAPHSYTGQDMAEIQLPGQPALLHRVLHACLAAASGGARLAEPGEFTFRGFLAGQLDLTQAEGIAATINAVSEGQLAAARHLRQGELGRWAGRLVEALARLLALLEAGIDFTDQEDVTLISPCAMSRGLADILGEIDHLRARSRSWSTLEALPRVVLAGAPNAGKSTLFNALLGRPRAVTSAIAGTTRDVLEEPLMLTSPTGQPFEIMLVDTAGLQTPATLLDRHIQSAGRQALDRADLTLVAVPADAPAGSLRATDYPPTTPGLTLRTKSDLSPSTLVTPDPQSLPVSARTGAGLGELRRRMADLLARRGVSLSADLLALQPRHESALETAAANLHHALDRLAPQQNDPAILSPELVAHHVRRALDALADLGGRLTPDDVLGRIFATFCIGK